MASVVGSQGAGSRVASQTAGSGVGSRVGSKTGASNAGSRQGSNRGSQPSQVVPASAAGSRASAAAAGASGKISQRSSMSQRSGPPPPQVPYMKEPVVAREFERIMANIVRAVLTTRPINIVRFISEYLENELIRRTFFELQSSMCKRFIFKF